MLSTGKLTLIAATATLLLFATIQSATADTLKIGVMASLTAPVSEALNGVKLAADEINKVGGVLGRQIELIVEDDQNMTESGVVQAHNKLAANSEIVAVISRVGSGRLHVIAPEVRKAGRPLMISGTDPKLTHMGNPWFFRCRPNDIYAAKVMAVYGVNDLKRRKWAILYTDDAFGNAGKTLLTQELKGFGVELVLVQGTPWISDLDPVDVDLMGFVTEAKRLGADLVVSYMAGRYPVALLRQMRDAGLEAIVIGSPTITMVANAERAGNLLHGTYGIADFTAKSSPVAEAFAQKYQTTYNLQADMLSAWAYDAMNVLAKAIATAGSTEPDKIRDAILAIRGYQGAEGTYDFDQNGDGLHGYNIVHNDNGTWVFNQHIDFKD
jgi:branched-chain amino acid transport system substrate-binding protein